MSRSGSLALRISFVRSLLGFLVLVLVGGFLHGCASSRLGVLPGFDHQEFRRRPIVVLRARGVHPFTGMAQGPFRSFARDGISDAEFERRLQAAFFERLAVTGTSSGIRIDTTSAFRPRDDSASFLLDGRSIRAYFAESDADSSKLQLILGPILFSTEQLGMPGVGGSFGTTSTHLYANMNWVIYDRAIHKAVAGGKLDASSTTFAGITNIITQSDWFAGARKLADALSQDILELR